MAGIENHDVVHWVGRGAQCLEIVADEGAFAFQAGPACPIVIAGNAGSL